MVGFWEYSIEAPPCLDSGIDAWSQCGVWRVHFRRCAGSRDELPQAMRLVAVRVAWRGTTWTV